MKNILTILLFNVYVLCMYAQGTTMNHDASFLQQLLVTEGAGGKLTPDSWYGIFHSDYKEWALGTGKSVARADFLRSISKEEGYAKDIDSSFVKRSEQEALYILDRSPNALDLAWQAEGTKLETKLQQFESIINGMSSYGVPNREIESFRFQYNCIVFGLDEIRKAYLPTSKRREQYLAIQEDITTKTKRAYDFVLYYDSLRKYHRYGQVQRISRARVASLVSSVKDRWIGTLSAVSRSKNR